MTAIEERVKSIISITFRIPVEDLDFNSCFPDDLCADSLDIIELVMAFEREFEIEIPDEEIEHIVTVGNAIDYLKANVQV